MAKITIKLGEWLDFLESRVGIDLYVYGGNGELFVNQLPKLVSLEHIDKNDKQTLTDVGRVLTLLQKRLFQQVDIYAIHGEDCSGLAVWYLLKNGIIKSDVTANGLFEKTKHHQIPLKEVRAGDYLFDGNDSNKWHVGYAVSDKYAVEAKSHDDGVVKTVIANRSWKYATRPDWYDGVEPVPTQPVLKRELYYKDGKTLMHGDDVKDCQTLLIAKGYNPGITDGIFGKKTEIAVKNFQSDNNLEIDGIVGKLTATALGFKWEG